MCDIITWKYEDQKREEEESRLSERPEDDLLNFNPDSDNYA